MLHLSETRDVLSIVSDQIGGPTPADKIAETLLIMAKGMQAKKEGRVYHFAGKPATSWAGFAREIFRQARKDVFVADIPCSDYPTLATRPLNSRMNCSKLESDFGIQAPDWVAGIARVLTDMNE